MKKRYGLVATGWALPFIFVLVVLLSGLPALAEDFEREVRRAECATAAFDVYSDEVERCLEEFSSDGDECSEIDDFRSRMRCKKRAGKAYERCGKRNEQRHNREKRRCAALE